MSFNVIFKIFTNKRMGILNIETGTQAGGNLTNEPWNLEERDNPLANTKSVELGESSSEGIKSVINYFSFCLNYLQNIRGLSLYS
jgi:hypothetical protein